jgi:ubiquinone/menaquinone biosynthesis C-methylase UbiE
MPGTDWGLALFRRSVLKQAKFKQISALLDDPRGKSNLDLGGDNGVLSLLLRQQGGYWSSGDLDESTVAAIKSMVGDRVYRLDGGILPFPDKSLDQIVVIDYLEHIEDDRTAVQEFARVLRPGGSLVVNVPHPKPRSLLTRVRHAIGLTDRWHGHVRPGYDSAALAQLLSPWFAVEVARTYSRWFSETLDTMLNGMYLKMSARRSSRASRKGTVITGREVHENGGAFRALGLAHPLFWGFSRLDHLLVGQAGYKLVARARLRIT